MGQQRGVLRLEKIETSEACRHTTRKKTLSNKSEPAVDAAKKRKTASLDEAAPDVQKNAEGQLGRASILASSSGSSGNKQAPPKAGNFCKKTKSPFKVLKGSSGTEDETLALYCSFTPSLYTTRPSTAYIRGKCFDLRDKLCTDALTCRMLDQCISASAASPSLLFLGLKDNLEPFNLFNFTKGKEYGNITILSHELDTVDSLCFGRGTVVQLHVDEKPTCCHCTVLFHDGTLFQFDYDTKGIGDFPRRSIASCEKKDLGHATDRKAPLAEHLLDACNNSRVGNLAPLETSSRVIKFHRLNNTVAYTDGFAVTVVQNGCRRASPVFRALIVDLQLFMRDGAEHIFLLDRNGGHFYCNADLTGYTSAGSFPGFYKLTYIPSYNLILSTDGMTYKNFSEIAVVPSVLRKACRFYLPAYDGSVTAHRLLNKDRRSQMLFRLANMSEGLVFCTSGPEFGRLGDSRMNISEIASFDAYLLLATEHGYIIRLNME